MSVASWVGKDRRVLHRKEAWPASPASHLDNNIPRLSTEGPTLTRENTRLDHRKEERQLVVNISAPSTLPPHTHLNDSAWGVGEVPYGEAKQLDRAGRGCVGL